MILYAFDNLSKKYSKTKMNQLKLGTYANKNQLKELGFHWNGIYWEIEAISDLDMKRLNELGIGIEEPITIKDYMEGIKKEFEVNNEIFSYPPTYFKSQLDEEYLKTHELMSLIEAKQICDQLMHQQNANRLYRNLKMRMQRTDDFIVQHMHESNYSEDEINTAKNFTDKYLEILNKVK